MHEAGDTRKTVYLSKRSRFALCSWEPCGLLRERDQGGAVNIFVGIEHLRRCNERIRCQRSAEGATHPVSRTY